MYDYRKPNVRTTVKNWYMRNYPSDELGRQIDHPLTFSRLWKGMLDGKDFYDIIGVGDSVIRERIFEAIAYIYGFDYKVVYNRWIDNAR